MKKVWVGNRLSEIANVNFFDYSITYYGVNTEVNFSFSTTIRIPTQYSNNFTDFTIGKIDDLIVREKGNIEFHFYNPIFAHKIANRKKELFKYFMNINSSETLSWINSKIFTRLWLSNSIDVPKFALLSKNECTVQNLCNLFKGSNSFIIQKHISGGGEGTYLIDIDIEEEVLNEISANSLYLVSPFYDNANTICCHIIVYNDYIIVFPFGIQNSCEIDNKFIYQGSDYISGQNISYDIKNILLHNAISVGKNLSHIGYRGICGFDFILVSNEILFIEVNARYLGSTFVINKALAENNEPSIFELNSDCFSNHPKYKDFNAQGLKINYRSKTERNGKKTLFKDDITKTISDFISSCQSEVFFDGLEIAQVVKPDTYLFREIIHRSFNLQ